MTFCYPLKIQLTRIIEHTFAGTTMMLAIMELRTYQGRETLSVDSCPSHLGMKHMKNPMV